METSILLTALVSASVTYLMLIPAFYYFLIEKLETIDTIVLSRNPRKRMELVKIKKEVKSDVFFVILWPVLVLRQLFNASKKKK